MRSAVLQMPPDRSAAHQRQVRRDAIRQVERAGVYLAAVSYMDLDDFEAARALARLRADLENFRRLLLESRAQIDP